MRTFVIAALAAFGIIGVSTGEAGASTVSVVFGTGTATFPGCPADSDLLIPILGAEAVSAWTFAVGDANLGPGIGCAIAAAGTFQGTAYSIAAGGCLPGFGAGIILCLGGFVAPGPATVPIFLCTVIAGCIAGAASLSAAEA